MQIGERPIFQSKYYKPQAKKYSRTSESDRMQTAATSESETESKRHRKQSKGPTYIQSKGMSYIKGHVVKTEDPEEEVQLDLRRPVLRNTEIKLFTTPTIKLEKKGSKIRYFISCSTGAFALGLPLADDEGNMTQDVLSLPRWNSRHYSMRPYLGRFEEADGA